MNQPFFIGFLRFSLLTSILKLYLVEIVVGFYTKSSRTNFDGFFRFAMDYVFINLNLCFLSSCLCDLPLVCVICNSLYFVIK